MRIHLIIVVMIMFTFTGCANNGNISANDEIPTQGTIRKLVLSPKPTLEPEKVEEPTEHLLQPTQEPGEFEDSLDGPHETPDTLVPPSGSVDLGEYTPTTTSEGEEELVEMPAPGVPDFQIYQVTLVIQDLSKRLGIGLEDISVEEVLEVDWNNSSLGCPAPGMMYLQVITPGFKITLEVNGQIYTYHTDMGDFFVLCVNGRPEKPFD